MKGNKRIFFGCFLLYLKNRNKEKENRRLIFYNTDEELWEYYKKYIFDKFYDLEEFSRHLQEIRYKMINENISCEQQLIEIGNAYK